MRAHTGLEDWESLLPSLPEPLARFARSITHGELNSLLSIFSSSTWTAILVVKILEVYCIAKRAAKHNEMLKVRHTVQRGGSMTQLQEEDPGAAPKLVCLWRWPGAIGFWVPQDKLPAEREESLMQVRLACCGHAAVFICRTQLVTCQAN